MTKYPQRTAKTKMPIQRSPAISNAKRFLVEVVRRTLISPDHRRSSISRTPVIASLNGQHAVNGTERFPLAPPTCPGSGIEEVRHRPEWPQPAAATNTFLPRAAAAAGRERLVVQVNAGSFRSIGEPASILNAVPRRLRRRLRCRLSCGDGRHAADPGLFHAFGRLDRGGFLLEDADATTWEWPGTISVECTS